VTLANQAFLLTIYPREIQMNKAQLIEALEYERPGVSKSSIKLTLNAMDKIIKTVLQMGEGSEVVLPGIGKISVKQSPARVCRNPRTGVEVQVSAKNKPHFSPSKALKDAVMSN
jgi:nucleoid DNA-binding protein